MYTNPTCSPVRIRRKSLCRLSLNLSEVWKRFQLGVAKIALNCTIAKDTSEGKGAKLGGVFFSYLVKAGSMSVFRFYSAAFFLQGMRKLK